MKKNKNFFRTDGALLARRIKGDPVFFGFLAGCLIAGAFALLVAGPGFVATRGGLENIAVGKVADRDISAGKDVSYIDEEATALRIQAEKRLVLPVFTIDASIAVRTSNKLGDYKDYVLKLVDENTPEETLFLMVQSRFPGLLRREELSGLARSPLRAQVFLYADAILSTLMHDGIFLIPSQGLDAYNPDYFELRRLRDGNASSEEMPLSRIRTLADIPELVSRSLQEKHLAQPLAGYASALVLAFATEDGFFDEAQSSAKLKKVADHIEPVRRAISKDEIIIRQGSIVTEADYARLVAVRTAVSQVGVGLLVSGLGLYAAAVLFGFLMVGREKISGTKLERDAGFLIAGSALLFLCAVLAVLLAGPGRHPLHGAYFLPVSLFVGLAVAISGTRFGVLYTVLLTLLSAAGSNLNAHIIVIVLTSGIAASFTVSTASSRISLVRAGLLQTLVQAVLTLFLTLQSGLPARAILGMAAMEGLNGFIGGSLVVAILPILEQAFNIPTRFRLMELSDLNAPALKQLLTAAPGTYSHSINVANLAETAAREIGADPLLARVGAYYHDIGKMEQPGYFVENQEGVNLHDEINPRLSATVIRSHVKIGQEKARELKLPQAVVDIVAQHHGNSVIAWFYDKAKKADPGAVKEDFNYPGEPPASRESGVVMLADAIEASTRTLKNPTLPRLEEFIRQIIMDKVQSGQLDNCSLTLKDLDTVRDSFLRSLGGHFHSRIEYPSQQKDKES